MKSNRILRSPIIWIALGFLAIALLFEVFNNAGGYTDKPTSQVVQLINSDTPLAQVVLNDGEQLIKVTTKDNPPQKLRAGWVGTQSQDIVKRLNERVAAGTIDSWNGEPPQPNLWGTFLFSVLPFLALGVVFILDVHSRKVQVACGHSVCQQAREDQLFARLALLTETRDSQRALGYAITVDLVRRVVAEVDHRRRRAVVVVERGHGLGLRLEGIQQRRRVVDPEAAGRGRQVLAEGGHVDPVVPPVAHQVEHLFCS